MMATSGCDHGNRYTMKTINMSIPAPTLPAPTPTAIPSMDNGTPWGPPPCEQYGAGPPWSDTILDEISNAYNLRPPTYNWQYIAHADDSIWSAPLGVNHLYQDWVNAGSPCSPTLGINEPFICDEDAWQFVSDRESATPLRPFADLTYITPCRPESDHPETNAKGIADGPEWLAYVLNAIGQSADWPHTAIIVVWDDWGG
jgi:Phosphoesterase family